MDKIDSFIGQQSLWSKSRRLGLGRWRTTYSFDGLVKRYLFGRSCWFGRSGHYLGIANRICVVAYVWIINLCRTWGWLGSDWIERSSRADLDQRPTNASSHLEITWQQSTSMTKYATKYVCWFGYQTVLYLEGLPCHSIHTTRAKLATVNIS